MNINKIDTVCIIDDDPIFVFGARRLMEMSDFCNSFLIFKNGKEALDHLKPLIQSKKDLPEVILLDLNMPVMDGWEFLDEFVKIPSKIPITIFIVSSSIDPEDMKRVDDYSIVSNYIIKPISQKAIERIKNEVLA